MAARPTYDELQQKIKGLEQQLIKRRREEEALRASEAKLVENLIQNYFLFCRDPEGAVTYVSPTITNVLGYSAVEFRERFPAMITDNPSNQTVAMQSAPGQRDGQSSSYELEVSHRDGTTAWLEVTEIPVTDESGTVTAIEHIAHDITSRKKAEEHLLQEKIKLESVFASMGDGLTIQDTDFRIIYQNSVHRDRYGDQLGQYCFQAYRQMENACDACILAECFADGQVHRREISARSKRGAIIYLEITAGPIRDAKGVMVAGFEVVRDITDQKRLAAQVIHAQKMESIGRLAGGVAHDFNNLLTGIIGYTGLCLEQVSEGAHLHEDLDEILTLAKRAAELTRQLLAFSRQQDLEPQYINLNELVGNFSRMLQRLLGEDVELVFTPGRDLGIVRADPGQMEQVLTNLAINARHAMPEGGRLQIGTANVYLDETAGLVHEVDVPPGTYVQLAVTDNGHGMPSGMQNQIFEPFFTTKEVGEGSGLGLSTVYGIVKQHHGYIWVYSEPGEGTTFKIYLPVQKDKVQSPGETAPLPEEPRGTEMVLLVEDDISVREVTERMLSKLGYRVVATGDPEEARRLIDIHGERIALLLTDVIMPDVNGRELYERLARRRPELKVLFMSGYTHEVITNKGVIPESSKFINKPFSRKELADKIREILSDGN